MEKSHEFASIFCITDLVKVIQRAKRHCKYVNKKESVVLQLGTHTNPVVPVCGTSQSKGKL